MWYSLSVIIWTILGTLGLMYYLIHDAHKKSDMHMFYGYGIMWVWLFLIFFQFILNFSRIASQGWAGPFLRYKSNVWNVTVTDEQLQSSTITKIGYSAKDVFDLQFPHYNPVLSILNARGKDEWVTIAGTYMQYFIHNQRNIFADGFLTDFWKNASDNNVCNTYHRIRDKKTKYIVIDPNIASVVMGGANSTLLDRFLWVIDEKGVLVLQSLVQQKYLSFITSNNIVTKYSFIASDEKLSALLNVPRGEKLLIERAKMSAARFFPWAQWYVSAAAQILAERMQTDAWVEDLADIMGKVIDKEAVTWLARRIVAWVKPEQQTEIQEALKKRTNDERLILQQYLSIKQSQSQPQQFRQNITSLISQSANNWSQLFVLSVE
jgi:hypothetical protein